MNKDNEAGEFYGVEGPGDKELITLKAVRIIKSVDCIFAPRADSKSQVWRWTLLRTLLQEKEL